MQRTFGQRPKPRMLVVGMDDDVLANRLRSLVPTASFVTAEQLNAEINQREWELAVLWECDAQIITEVNVVQFGGSRTARMTHSTSTFFGYVDTEVPSTVYKLPENSVAEVGRLAPRLGEHLSEAGRSCTMAISTLGFSGVIVPFLLNSNGHAVAGIFRRSERGPREWWWLPAGAPEPDHWVAAALARWRAAEPDRFEPDVTDWLSDPRWQTNDERAGTEKLQALEAKHADAVKSYMAERAALEAERQRASEMAELKERRLLTSQGDELKDEVAHALRDLGFRVEDADVEHAKKGDLLEDLRVFDWEDPDWVALVEVRGYTGGAKLSDLQRIARFVARYAAASGKLPDATWYVVNQFIGTDPGTRPEPLASNTEEVRTFAEDGGLVVDTKDLFGLRERVRGGEVSKEDARTQLKASGRLPT